jgi:hypothetical protein
MTKRKANKPRKLGAGATGAAKRASTPKRVSAPALMAAQDDELQAAPDTETRLPELPGHEMDNELPPTPPLELESEPALAPEIAEPKLDVTRTVEAQAEIEESVHAAAGEAKTSPTPSMNRPIGAAAGIEAYRTLLMEMAQDNLDFAARLASMRSPFEIVDVATTFAGKQIGLYGRFSKAVVDIATGRQPPTT